MMGSQKCVNACRRFLIQFAHEHLDFRLHELQSLAWIFGEKLSICQPLESQSPYLVVEIASEDLAKAIAGRSVLIKSIYELWTAAHTYEELHSKLKSLPHSFTEPYTQAGTSFRIRHESFNKAVEQKEKLLRIENVLDGPIDFQGKVNLSRPDHSFFILEQYTSPEAACGRELECVYFARWLSDGHRDHINNFNLKKRKFIANTSMDPTLSLLMANMGMVKDNSLVFDPFVGSGSLLVSSAHYGGHVLGTDIDWQLLHGQGKSSRHTQKYRGNDESIRANLKQYDLEHRYIDALVADASRQSLWRVHSLFDAIITDPPYGIREKTEKVGTKKEEAYVPDDMRKDHIPSKVPYGLSQILSDLLVFSARSLRVGGRLVYWLPVLRDEYVSNNVPSHPCLELVANSEQPLSSRIARRLITMEKVKEVEDGDLLPSAVKLEDHYKDSSFREKYFSDERRRHSPPRRSPDQQV